MVRSVQVDGCQSRASELGVGSTKAGSGCALAVEGAEDAAGAAEAAEEAADVVDAVEVTDDVTKAVAVDLDEWRAELPLIEEWFAKIGDRLPAQLHAELDGLKERLA